MREEEEKGKNFMIKRSGLGNRHAQRDNGWRVVVVVVVVECRGGREECDGGEGRGGGVTTKISFADLTSDLRAVHVVLFR